MENIDFFGDSQYSNKFATSNQSDLTNELEQSNNSINIVKSNSIDIVESNSINIVESIEFDKFKQKEQIELFTNQIDRRIGNYLMDELEKKQNYIGELELLIKYQQDEISSLKSKLNSIDKLELVAKIKSNLNLKSDLVEKHLNECENEMNPESRQIQEHKISNVKTIQIKKSSNNLLNNQTKSETNSNTNEEFKPKNNDLILESNSIYSNLKFESEPDSDNVGYNGIIILEKPKTNSKESKFINRFTENDTEINGDAESEMEKTNEILRRRRARRH